MGKSVLLIGANGRVGRMLQQIWPVALEMHWLSRCGTTLTWELEDGVDVLRKHMEGVSAVICLAGSTGDGNSPLSLNVKLAQSVIRAATGFEVKSYVFLASSQAVYGEGPGLHCEAVPACQAHDYGRSKLKMEKETKRLAAEAGVGLTSLRLANVVGADSLFRNVSLGKDIVVDLFPDGRTPRRSYLDPVALARILQRLIEMANAGVDLPEVINIASDPPMAMGDLLAAADIEYVTHSAPPSAKAEVAMDRARLRRLMPDLAEPTTAKQMIAGWRKATRPL